MCEWCEKWMCIEKWKRRNMPFPPFCVCFPLRILHGILAPLDACGTRNLCIVHFLFLLRTASNSCVVCVFVDFNAHFTYFSSVLECLCLLYIFFSSNVWTFTDSSIGQPSAPFTNFLFFCLPFIGALHIYHSLLIHSFFTFRFRTALLRFPLLLLMLLVLLLSILPLYSAIRCSCYRLNVYGKVCAHTLLVF
uniref:Uncharacterized protein TCIL3000_9_700 n=1 Tax=Trypanosoma congolense (strain IL3000) TaxID=1068625 RepID=G0UTG2_TRYCI|nr:unnamed protein product [Trypanosoma congolense IL3000]